MRFILTILLAWPIFLLAQPAEMNLLGTWNDPSIVPTAAFNGAYNEIWGLFVNDHEIAVIGSTEGTHFIDVTDPTNPTEIMDAFVPGATSGPDLIHRDYHDYQGFLYAVADENNNSTLQIIDIRDLPNSTTTVYDDNELIIRAHNIFIDSTQARMYACGIRRGIGGGSTREAMTIYDISNPGSPVELGAYNNIGTIEIPYVHDVFVRDNIAYMNGGNSGFFVGDFTDPANPVLLGSMTDYVQAGYNHSGWLDDVGHYYFLADETHGLELKVVDVCSSDDLQVMNTFGTDSGIPSSIPHNVLIDCNILYASWYYEGIQVFDISDPVNPVRIGFYDTFDGQDEAFFAGNWGVYPYLPSGNILASDMQTGLYVIENIATPDCDAYQVEACENAVSIKEIYQPLKDISIFPQPVQDQLNVDFYLEQNIKNLTVELTDINGRIVNQWPYTNRLAGENNLQLDIPNQVYNGFYIMTIRGDEVIEVSRKMVVQR